MIPGPVVTRFTAPLAVIFLILLIFFAGIFLGRRDRHADTSSTVYKAQIAQATRYGDSLFKTLQTVRDSAHASQAHSDSLTGRIGAQRARLNRLNDSLDVLISKLPVKVYPGCQLYADAVTLCQHIRDSLNAVVTAQDQRDSTRIQTIRLLTTGLNLATQRGDSLSHVVTNIPTHLGTCRVMFIPCPSRKTSVIVGILIGGAGSLYLSERMR